MAEFESQSAISFTSAFPQLAALILAALIRSAARGRPPPPPELNEASWARGVV
jgi:hypothetical protein